MAVKPPGRLAPRFRQRIEAYAHIAESGRPVLSGIGQSEEGRIAWPQHSTVHRDRPHLGHVAVTLTRR